MKVSRKVGRRSRKHTSSISRRRLRSKKSYKKNSYRKKYTQKGGCWGRSNKGGPRGRKYKRARTHTHKRGKRFHRGGNGHNKVFDTKLTTQDPEPTTPRLYDDALPQEIWDWENKKKRITKMDNALYFDYKRTDGFYKRVGKPVEGLFDVVILWNNPDHIDKIYLLRRIKDNFIKYEKKFIIDYDAFVKYFNTEEGNDFTGILGYNIDSGPEFTLPATYTLPASGVNNNKNLKIIWEYILQMKLSNHSRIL